MHAHTRIIQLNWTNWTAENLKKKNIKNQNFEKKSLGTFCSFFLDVSFLYHDLTHKKFKLFKLEKTPTKSNYWKSHTVSFVPFSWIYRFQSSAKKGKNGHLGGGWHQTVNTWILPKYPLQWKNQTNIEYCQVKYACFNMFIFIVILFLIWSIFSSPEMWLKINNDIYEQ